MTFTRNVLIGLMVIVALVYANIRLSALEHEAKAADKATALAFVRSGEPDPQEVSCLRYQPLYRLSHAMSEVSHTASTASDRDSIFCENVLDGFHHRVAFYAVDRGWGEP